MRGLKQALPAALATTVLAVQTPAFAADPIQDTIYAVTINGREVSDGALLGIDSAGDFFASDDELREWRLNVPDPSFTIHNGKQYHRLRLPGIKIVVHTSQQSLSITVPAKYFSRTDVEAEQADRTPATGHRSITLDYVVDARHQGAGTYLSSFLDSYTYLAGGELDTRFQVYGGTDLPFVAQRLATSWTHDVPTHRSDILIGDSTSNGGLLGDSVRFIGLQYGTNFNMFPELVVRAEPRFFGTAANTGTVNVYANGQLLSTAPVPVGPFSVGGSPYLDGETAYDVIVKDPTGREYAVQQSYYADSRLLAPGTHSYAYSIGAEDTETGLNSYGPVFAEGTERVGISNELTAEGTLEYGAVHKVAAASAVFGIPHVGSFSAGLGFEGGDRSRMLSDLSYDYANSRYAFSAFVREVPNPYRLIGIGSNISQSSGVSFSARGSGSNGITLEYAHNYVPGVFSTNTLSLNATRVIGPLQLQIYGVKNSGQFSSTVFGFAFSRQIGRHAAAYSSVTSEDGRMEPQAGVSGDAGRDQSLRIDAQIGGTNGRTGELRLDDKSPAVDSILDVSTGNGYAGYVDASIRGSLAAIGHGVYAPDLSGSPYALVETGFAGVPVYRNHMFVGRTDRNGNLFVPMLAPYQENTLSIDVSSLPFGVTAETEKTLVPLPNSGNIVRFRTVSSGAVTFTLVDAAGKPVPAGAEVVNAGGHSATVGLDGLVFFENPPAGTMIVRATMLDGKHCRAEIAIPKAVNNVPNVGKIPCV